MIDAPVSDRYGENRLLIDLINIAFTSGGTGFPTLVRVSDQDGADILTGHGWPLVEVAGTDTFVESVAAAALTGPVLALPPWGYRSAQGPIRSFEDEVLAALPANIGHLVGLLTPASILTTSRARSFRELLLTRWTPRVIMTARGGLAHVHPAFESALVLLQARRDDEIEPIRFFRVPVRPVPAAACEELTNLLKRQGGQSANGYVTRTRPTPGDSLAYERHDPQTRARAADLVNFGSTVPLGDLFELLQARPARPGTVPESADAIREVSGRDIQRDGRIAPPDPDSQRADRKHLVVLQEGDLVLRALRNTIDSRGLVIAVVSVDDLPAAAGRHTIVLRPRESLTFAQKRLFTMFAKSRLANTLLNAATGHSMGITVSSLVDLPIPQPDDALADALGDLADAADQLAHWNSETELLIESVFDLDSASAARARMIANGRTLRLRVDSARLLDDFDHSVRSRFPYPIAYRWRTLEALRSGSDHERAYLATLECFETLLCYGACVAMIMAANARVPLKSRDAIRAKLASGRGGTSLGDWVSVLEEVASGRQFKSLSESVPLGEIRDLLTRDTLDSRKRLSDRRNDQSHLRRLRSAQIEEAANEAFEDLVVLMKQSRSLMDLSLVHVTATQWDAFKGTSKVQTRRLVGDHSVVPYRDTEVARNDLEPGSLYIADTSGGLHLARPFLAGRECPDCGMWSTFHLDRLEDGQPIVKSLEVGHTMPDLAQADAFKSVGLLQETG